MSSTGVRALAAWRPVPGFEEAYAVQRDGRVMRVAPGHHTSFGHIISPGSSVVAMQYGGLKRVVRRTSLVREVFGDDAVTTRRGPKTVDQPGAFLPMRPVTCWCWDTLKSLMEVEPASVRDVALAVYGHADDAARRAASQLLCDLAKPDYPYVGGPYVVRAKRGWYGLADREPEAVPSELKAANALTRYPRTRAELAGLLGLSRFCADWVLRPLQARGVLRSATAPQSRWKRTGFRPIYVKWYWLGDRAARLATEKEGWTTPSRSSRTRSARTASG